MASDSVSGIRAVALGDLIGAPLAAFVEADVHAARATLDYIREVGFEGDDDGREPDPAGGPVPIGRMRMARFRYSKPDENNSPADFIAEVPLLSLVQIPALQVRQAKVSFAARIVDVAVETPPPAPEGPRPGQPTSALPPRRVSMVARPAASEGRRNQEMRGTFHLDIEVSLAQADVAVGLEKLLTVMDTAITDGKAEPGP